MTQANSSQILSPFSYIITPCAQTLSPFPSLAKDPPPFSLLPTPTSPGSKERKEMVREKVPLPHMPKSWNTLRWIQLQFFLSTINLVQLWEGLVFKGRSQKKFKSAHPVLVKLCGFFLYMGLIWSLVRLRLISLVTEGEKMACDK